MKSFFLRITYRGNNYNNRSCRIEKRIGNSNSNEAKREEAKKLTTKVAADDNCPFSVE
jgi:hypothetical protein